MIQDNLPSEGVGPRPSVRWATTCYGYVVDLRDFHAWLDAQGLALDTLDREDTERWLKSLADRGLDIPGPVVSHRLRHTYATELLNAGQSIIAVMKLLGHRSLRMTMRYAAITHRPVKS
jgi:site-specific recombinase XerD